jgi:endogenous inhibitor of DNA gyrase (YacG/DUF329 family)
MKITCPQCKTTTTWEENPHRPFCSERCKLIDLGKWASGDYVVKEKLDDESEPSKENDNG